MVAEWCAGFKRQVLPVFLRAAVFPGVEDLDPFGRQQLMLQQQVNGFGVEEFLQRLEGRLEQGAEGGTGCRLPDAELLGQPEKLLSAGDGIGDGVQSVDDDGGPRTGGPDHRWTKVGSGLQAQAGGVGRPGQNQIVGGRSDGQLRRFWQEGQAKNGPGIALAGA